MTPVANRVRTGYGDVEVLDVQGKPHRLRELWAHRPCVLVFVRHFGWVLCRKQVSELRPQIPRIRQAGGDVAIVGTGAPVFAKALQEELGIPDVPILSDPSGQAFVWAGFRRGILPMLKPRAVWNYLHAFFSGYVSRRVQGDPLQQGGVLVVNPDGTLLFEFRSSAAGDAPEADDIVAALGTGCRARFEGF